MIVDARRLDGHPLLRADVVIVGGGVAGIVMALELERAGVGTLLLESGGLAPDRATSDLNRGTSIGLPYRFADGSRSRFLGGSSNCWGGWCRPFDPWDFDERPWVPSSGWPLSGITVPTAAKKPRGSFSPPATSTTSEACTRTPLASVTNTRTVSLV